MLSEQHREVYYDKYSAGINFKCEIVGLKYPIKAVKGCDISHHNGNPLPCLNHKCTSGIQQNQTGTDVILWLWPLISYYLSTLPFTVAYVVLCTQEKSANLIIGKFMWQQTCPYRPASAMTFHKTQHSTRLAERKKNLFLKYLTDLDSAHCHLISLPAIFVYHCKCDIFLPFTLNTCNSSLKTNYGARCSACDKKHVTLHF